MALNYALIGPKIVLNIFFRKFFAQLNHFNKITEEGILLLVSTL